MSTRKPDFKVVVAQSYTTKSGEEKTRWYNVGAAWTGAKGISFNICTLPGVSLYLFPAEDADKTEREPVSKQATSRWYDPKDDQSF